MEFLKNRMPTLFVGHGSPMNAVEDNAFTRVWQALGASMPRPSAILAVSAHWYTHGSLVADTAQPTQVYDFYGFPRELYKVRYPAAGAPELAHRARALVDAGHTGQGQGSPGQGSPGQGSPGQGDQGQDSRPVAISNDWGIDHGTWSVLCRMYPDADIPVCQLSIDRDAGPAAHFQIGQALSPLRDEGVLILGSGNVVHNLALVDWSEEGGFPWAESFDNYIHDSIQERRFDDVVQYDKAGESARIAFHMPDHFYPLLYTLGAVRPDDRLTVFNRACTLGSLSMTSYLFS